MPSPVLIVIPAKHEGHSVGYVVSQVRTAYDYDVLVVDDCSKDSTAEKARAAGALVFSLPIGLGAWGAMQTGIRYAMEKGYEAVLTMDADGQHLSKYIPDLLEPILNGEADVVIGACTKRGSRMRHIAWAFYRFIGGLTIEDLTSGFRAYNRSAMAVLSLPAATLLDYQDMGVLLLLLKANMRIREVEVEMCRRMDGHSRIFNSWLTVGKYMLLNSILCLSRRLSARPKRGEAPSESA